MQLKTDLRVHQFVVTTTVVKLVMHIRHTRVYAYCYYYSSTSSYSSKDDIIPGDINKLNQKLDSPTYTILIDLPELSSLDVFIPLACVLSSSYIASMIHPRYMYSHPHIFTSSQPNATTIKHTCA